MVMNNTCIVCGNSVFKPIYNESLIKCLQCKFVTANLEISKEELHNLYAENYFLGEEYLDYIADKQVLQNNFTRRIHKIKKYIQSFQSLNFLEIGCAYGFFGELLVREFPAQYIGIDVSKEAINYAKHVLGLNVKLGEYLDLPAPSNKYTDVFMWDVIEHIQSPHLYVKKIADEIVNNGRLYITTGDIESIMARTQKTKWRLIHPPTHLHYFSRKTITMLLEKNGFTIQNIIYPTIYRSFRQTYYSLFLLNKKQSRLKLKFYELIPSNWFFPINTYDIMFVIAKKV